jgi:transmembrane sensor
MKSKDVMIEASRDLEDEAAEVFLRQRAGRLSADEESQNDRRLGEEPAYADAALRVHQMWRAVGDHSASPELMRLREQALARTRRAGAKRWAQSARDGLSVRWKVSIAAAALLAIVGAIQISPLGYRPGLYVTSWGEQRTLDLPDHSRIVMDARTRLKVRYSGQRRLIQLIEGQAQFSVAKDSARSFEVEAGDRKVVALGTVFTVEYVDRQTRVAMVEGRVAVLPLAQTAGEEKRVELSAGTELRVQESGRSKVIREPDVAAMTAWREGKLIFHDEALADAVRRVNRHSRERVEIDDSALAALHVSGVFDADDAQAFAQAIETYLPVTADRTEPDVIRLRRR